MNLLGTTKSDLNVRAKILELAQKKGQVIYGARAVNKQLPVNLRRKTKDYDIYTKKPKMAAEELASELNKEFDTDEFKVEPARYSKTFKVKRNNEAIADYTLTTKKPKTKNDFGVKYADIEYQKKKIKKILKDEKNSYRFDKDLDTLQRIKEYKRRFNL